MQTVTTPTGKMAAPTLWELPSGAWLQSALSEFSPSNGRAQIQSPLAANLIRPAWFCASCLGYRPNDFAYCPSCGAGQPLKGEPLPWYPPNGKGSSLHNMSFDLKKLATHPQTFERPGLGDFVYLYGAAGLGEPALTALDMAGGGVWIKNPSTTLATQQTKPKTQWIQIKPAASVLPALMGNSKAFATHLSANAWLLPTQAGLQCLTIDPAAAKYTLTSSPQKPQVSGLGSVGQLDQFSAMPVRHEGKLAVQTFEPNQWNLVPVAGAKLLPTTNYGLPIVDAARRQLIWVSTDHFLVLKQDGELQLAVYLWQLGKKACPEFGSPYQDLTGQYWQLCYDSLQHGYGYHKISTQASTPLDWRGVDSPVLSIGHFSTQKNAYTQREPWNDNAYLDQDAQDIGFKLALTQTTQPDNRGAALYLQVPFEGSIADLFQDAQTQYACELKVTGNASVLAILPIRQPWKTQVFVTPEGLHVAHPDLTDIYLYPFQSI